MWVKNINQMVCEELIIRYDDMCEEVDKDFNLFNPF